MESGSGHLSHVNRGQASPQIAVSAKLAYAGLPCEREQGPNRTQILRTGYACTAFPGAQGSARVAQVAAFTQMASGTPQMKHSMRCMGPKRMRMRMAHFTLCIALRTSHFPVIITSSLCSVLLVVLFLVLGQPALQSQHIPNVS